MVLKLPITRNETDLGIGEAGENGTTTKLPKPSADSLCGIYVVSFGASHVLVSLL
jgi:hypothetical protein